MAASITLGPSAAVRTRARAFDAYALAALVLASAAARTVLGFWRTTLVYYPDEYLYSALARSVAATGVPHVRGGSAHFPALLGPYLMAPPWLVGSPETAYRLALGWASLWFSLAAVPAWALARRVGVSRRGGLLVAALTLLVPEGALTTTLLSEPFAYPLFLSTSLLAVSTIAKPTRGRQVGLVVLMVALTLVRIQFVAIPLVYVAAALACSGFSLRTLRRTQPIVLVSLAGGAMAASVVGVHRLAGVYGGLDSYGVGWGIAPWVLVNLLVVLVAAGWVVAPGAVVGLRGLWETGGAERALAVYAPLTLGAVILEAALFGENEGAALGRYTFYAVPLVLVAFVSSLEAHRTRPRTHAAAGYALAGLALLSPVVTSYATAVAGQAPALLGLDVLAGGSARDRSLQALALGIAAAVTALRIGGPRATAAAATAIVAVVGAAGTAGMFGVGAGRAAPAPRPSLETTYPVPPGSALLVTPATTSPRIMNVLFWNPHVTRVLVLGGGGAADGYPSTQVRLTARGLVDATGAVQRGPFVVEPEAAAMAVGAHPSPRAFRRPPPALIFGWNRSDGYLATTSFAFVAAKARPVSVRFRLRSGDGRKKVAFLCGRTRRVVDVARLPVDFQFGVRSGRSESCRISLVGGRADDRDGRTVGVRAEVSVSA